MGKVYFDCKVESICRIPNLGASNSACFDKISWDYGWPKCFPWRIMYVVIVAETCFYFNFMWGRKF